MTETEWQTCTDPEAMLAFVRESGQATDRKLRVRSRMLSPNMAVSSGRAVPAPPLKSLSGMRTIKRGYGRTCDHQS